MYVRLRDFFFQEIKVAIQQDQQIGSCPETCFGNDEGASAGQLSESFLQAVSVNKCMHRFPLTATGGKVDIVIDHGSGIMRICPVYGCELPIFYFCHVRMSSESISFPVLCEKFSSQLAHMIFRFRLYFNTDSVFLQHGCFSEVLLRVRFVKLSSKFSDEITVCILSVCMNVVRSAESRQNRVT